MSGQRTIKYLLSISLSMVLLSGSLRAGPGFLDDFSDGNIQDGSPVTWGWLDDGTSDRLVTSEGLHLNSTAPYAILRDDQGNDVIYAGNMTIRMQLRMDSSEDYGNTGMYFRGSGSSDTYQAGIILNQLYLGRMSNSTWTVLQQPTISDFSPTQQDIIIEIDVTDFRDATGQRTSQLEVYSWFPGQNKPAQPQISAVDSTFSQGGIGMYVDRCSAIFRWVEVISEPTEPIVDFNGDGTVDIKDLLRLIEAWGQNDPAVDIVPDAVVDEKDLEVLMGYWQQDVNDPTLLAHWALDETEGDLAYDSVGFTNATLLGGPTWELDGGAIDGALRLDGQDDCLVVNSALNPAEGPFSILAWVKGGAAGQTIVSQADGENWLSADTATGCLMTDLKGAGRDSSSLCSGAVIADGNWHRVGLVCDGENRILYVDDVLVAEDTQAAGMADCSGGLNIGCGKDMASGTFFSGLIDDVRIYDRAVKP